MLPNAMIVRHDRDPARYLWRTLKGSAVGSFHPWGDCGVLVAPRWVLTAAHVMRVLAGNGNNRGLPYVPFDQTFTFADETPVACDRLVIHPAASEDPWANDLALVRLTKPVADRSPALIFDREDADADGGCEVGRVAWFAGCGDTGHGNNEERWGDERWRIAFNQVEAANDQWLRFRFDQPQTAAGPVSSDVETSFACDLEGISGSGDSGGPAFVRLPEGDRLIGISSYQDGETDGCYGVREFYSRVSSYRQWISEVAV
ncbi:MAG: trypsin-like serine protease [Pseudomonadota bacterium]